MIPSSLNRSTSDVVVPLEDDSQIESSNSKDESVSSSVSSEFE